MSTDMLENICDGSQYCPSINRRAARYRIRDSLIKVKQNGKECYLSMRSMSKGLHKAFKAFINEISQSLPIWGESGS